MGVDKLITLNIAAWEAPDLPLTAKLDSSIKKNVSLVRRLRTITSKQTESIIKEIDNVTLDKYLSEILPLIYECLTRTTNQDDIWACVQVISKLHHRFKLSFNQPLLEMILDGMMIYDDSEESRVILMNLFTCFIELVLVGVFRKFGDYPDVSPSSWNLPTKDNEELILFPVLKKLIQMELSDLSFLVRLSSTMNIVWPIINELTGDDRAMLVKILDIYHLRVVEITTTLTQRLNKCIQTSNRSNLRYGKSFDENTAELETLQEHYDLSIKALKIQSKLLGTELPEFTLEPLITDYEQQSVIQVEYPENFWESEEERSFYTDIPTLDELGDVDLSDYEGLIDGGKITLFLSHFENLEHENDINDLVCTFQKLNLNNLATKNRFFRFFTESFKSINFKIYAKFLKINQETIKDLLGKLIEFFDKKLIGQSFSDRISFRFVYFYIELIKFKLIPNYLIFHKIGTLIRNIALNNNDDLLTVFFERCGRYLINDVDYMEIANQMIALLKKQTSVPKYQIDNLVLIIESARVDGTKPVEVVKQTMTLKQSFILALFQDINDNTINTIVGIMKKVDLMDKEFFSLAIGLFMGTSPTNLNSRMSLLKRIEQNEFLDQFRNKVLESIQQGCQSGDYTLNKDRILKTKVINEMFQKKLFSFDDLIDLCYKVLNHGHKNNQPLPYDYSVKLDLPNNFFKIQMICTLFSNIHLLKLVKGNEKLEIFMVYFQYYIFCKEPLPLQVQFDLEELFENIAQCVPVERFENLNEVLVVLKEISAKRLMKKSVVTKEEEARENGTNESTVQNEVVQAPVTSVHQVQVQVQEPEQEPQPVAVPEPVAIPIPAPDPDPAPAPGLPTSSPKKPTSTNFERELELQYLQVLRESQNSSNAPRSDIRVPVARGSKFNLLVKNGKRDGLREISLKDDSLRQRILKQKAERKTHNSRTMELFQRMDSPDWEESVDDENTTPNPLGQQISNP